MKCFILTQLKTENMRMESHRILRAASNKSTRCSGKPKKAKWWARTNEHCEYCNKYHTHTKIDWEGI